jgi:hypothetical protein
MKHVILQIQAMHDGEMDDVVHHVSQLMFQLQYVVQHTMDKEYLI